MHRMRWFALTSAVVMLFPATVWATKVEKKEFICPLDGTKFSALALVSTDKLNGVDSDFCAWPKGSSGLPYEVQVCPKCFYATRNEYFNQDLPGDVKEKLQAALEKWREKHEEVESADGLTPGQRWELTAISGAVKHNHPPLMGYLWQRAAWAARHHMLRELKLALGDPMSSFEILDSMERDLKEEKKADRVVERTFRLVMASQRVGDVPRRETYLKTLEGTKLDEGQKARLVELKKSIEAESLYQHRLTVAYDEALEKELVKPEHAHIYLFIIADTTRRLGKNAEAVTLYRKVKESGKVRPDVERMCDFLINWLTPE